MSFNSSSPVNCLSSHLIKLKNQGFQPKKNLLFHRFLTKTQEKSIRQVAVQKESLKNFKIEQKNGSKNKICLMSIKYASKKIFEGAKTHLNNKKLSTSSHYSKQSQSFSKSKENKSPYFLKIEKSNSMQQFCPKLHSHRNYSNQIQNQYYTKPQKKQNNQNTKKRQESNQIVNLKLFSNDKPNLISKQLSLSKNRLERKTQPAFLFDFINENKKIIKQQPVLSKLSQIQISTIKTMPSEGASDKQTEKSGLGASKILKTESAVIKEFQSYNSSNSPSQVMNLSKLIMIDSYGAYYQEDWPSSDILS